MGTVFLAEHVLIKRRLALKVLHSQLAADVSIVERFMNEARAAGTLGHPNIVESTDMGFTRDNVPYIVFEYLQGSLLTDEIYRVGGLPIRRALRIAYQIASALDAAHSAGIVHRDLKSDNVFLTDRDDVSDHVKVLDFGVSRFIELETDHSGAGMVMGTPEYMAPEQVTSPETVDVRADIYGLGVILYEMLAARCPYRADHDPHSVLHQVLNDPTPPLDLPGLPPGLETMILTKLLAKDRSQRYATMKDVCAAIETFHLIIRPAGSRTPLSVPIVRPPTDAGARSEKIISLPPAPRRTASPIRWLLGAVVAAGAASASMLIDRNAVVTNSTSVPGLTSEAQRLASALENGFRTAQLRAEGIATTPMLRAAVETDAATLKDMAGADFLFTPKPDEILEVFQLRDGASVSLLRIPDNAPPIMGATGTTTRFEVLGSKLRVVASVPITKQGAGVGGSLALSMPVDLTAHRTGISAHAFRATLVGFVGSVVLADKAGVGDTVVIVVPVSPELKLGTLKLEATIPSAVVAAPRFRVARFAGLGIGVVLLLIYLSSLLRNRSRG